MRCISRAATCCLTSTAAATHSSTVSCQGTSGVGLKPHSDSGLKDVFHIFVTARPVVIDIRGIFLHRTRQVYFPWQSTRVWFFWSLRFLMKWNYFFQERQTTFGLQVFPGFTQFTSDYSDPSARSWVSQYGAQIYLCLFLTYLFNRNIEMTSTFTRPLTHWWRLFY